MARVAGVNIPNEKRIIIALTYIYGIGKFRAKKVLEQVKIDENKRTKDLNEQELNQIREALAKYKVEGDLKREILTNIRRVTAIGAWRGIRHAKGLPVRGQRTKTNSRTRRGNVRKTMMSGRAPAAQKT